MEGERQEGGADMMPVETDNNMPFEIKEIPVTASGRSYMVYEVPLFQGGVYYANSRDSATQIYLLSRILHFAEMK